MKEDKVTNECRFCAVITYGYVERKIAIKRKAAE